MYTYIFGTPGSSRKTRAIDAKSLDDAIITFRTETLYPELYVKEEMIQRVIEERAYPYDPVLELKPGAYVEIFASRTDRDPISTILCSEILTSPLSMEGQKLLPGKTAATDVPSKEGVQLTKAGLRSDMDTLIARKMELENQLTAVKAEIALMEERLSNAAKTLRLMKNYAGIDAEIVRIRDGAPASEDTPLCTAVFPHNPTLYTYALFPGTLRYFPRIFRYHPAWVCVFWCIIIHSITLGLAQ